MGTPYEWPFHRWISPGLFHPEKKWRYDLTYNWAPTQGFTLKALQNLKGGNHCLQKNTGFKAQVDRTLVDQMDLVVFQKNIYKSICIYICNRYTYIFTIHTPQFFTCCATKRCWYSTGLLGMNSCSAAKNKEHTFHDHFG